MPAHQTPSNFSDSGDTVAAGVYRILVADDQDAIRRLICANLSGSVKFTICGEARNGAEAVEKTIALRPDAIVLDIGMPRLNGLEAARRIRRESPNTSILILSIHKSKQLLEEASKIGVQGYVSKSDAGRTLVHALEVILQEGGTFFPADGEL